MAQDSCTIEGCKNARVRGTSGWCATHLRRWYRTGEVGGPIAATGGTRSLAQRMAEKIEHGSTESDCWTWTGRIGPTGYGYVWADNTMRSAHRVSYEQHLGPIPDGLHIDHLCRNRSCVNPRHLQAVTPAENTLRGISIPAINARLTHCRRGHAFDEVNTNVDRRGRRSCRACKSANEKAKRAAVKASA